MRTCGECTLCCRLTPVAEVNKDAGQRCAHQRMGKGCAIYDKRPSSCRYWNCRWLADPESTPDLSRPDRSHYVLDIVPDYVTTVNNDTGEKHHVQVVQIWIDPRYPLAHRDPQLRAYLLRLGEEGIAAIVRYDSSKAVIIFPPNMATDGKWHEEGDAQVDHRTHSLKDVAQALEGDVVMTVRPGGTHARRGEL